MRYAVTGSLAASLLAPVAPPRLAMVYVAAVEPVVEALKLRPAEAGINVMLLLPFDEIVFERTSQVQGLTLAAPSQVAADLLGSPGRGPNEAEAVCSPSRQRVMSDADVLYIVARRALLDALEALGAQRSALILVGAQAIYLHTGQADLAVAVYTTDADLVVEPGALADAPKIGDLMYRRASNAEPRWAAGCAAARPGRQK